MKRAARDTLALLGPRGSGKSSVGLALAARLGRSFVDLDDAVLRFGRYSGIRASTVGELLERAGRARFRELEATALRQILEPCPRIVLATGGGVVERVDNRAWLARAATSVYLSVPVARLRARLAADPTPRPALLGTDPLAEVEEVLARRLPLYQGAADLLIDCGEDGPDEIARRIVEGLGSGRSAARSP